MADPLRNAGGSSTVSDEGECVADYDEELDFFSPKFNPQRALHAPNITVPHPEIKSFPSVQSYKDAVERRQQSQSRPTSKSTDVGLKQQSKPTSKSTDVGLKQQSSTSKSTDVGLKQQSSSTSKSTDVGLKKQSSTSKSTDVGLKQQSSSTSKSTDVELKQQSSSTSKSTDVGLKHQSSSTSKSTDVGLKQQSSSTSKSTDVGLKQQSSSTSKSTDVGLKQQSSSTSKSTDVGLKQQSSSTSKSTDVGLKQHSSSTSKSTDVGLKQQSSSRHNSKSTDVGLKQLSSNTSSKFTDVGLKQRSIQSDNSQGTEITAQTSKRDEKSSSEKSIVTAASKSAEKPHPESSKSHEKKSESERPLKSQERLTHALSKNYERQTSTVIKRPEVTPTPISPTIYGLTSSRSNERPINLPIKNEEMSTSCERPSSTLSSSHERSSSSSSRIPEKLFHASKGIELPSGISSLEKQGSFDVARKHSESKESSQTKGSGSLGGEVQKAPTAEHKEKSDKKIPAFPDNAESSSASTQSIVRKCRTRRNVFTRMETMTGPLRLLTRCVHEHLQVRVMTRGAVSVRGICRGYVVAFDKHLNMAMIDVDEIYRRPAVLGKIKSRISHKLLAAQKTLQKEREEHQAQLIEDISQASCSFQDLSIKANVRLKSQQLVSAVSQKQEQVFVSEASTSGQSHPSGHSLSKSVSHSNQSMIENEMEKIKVTKIAQSKLQSVYEGLKAPLSPFEREALMLGIPDENVNHRHIHQMFIRGENVVSVSIIEDI